MSETTQELAVIDPQELLETNSVPKEMAIAPVTIDTLCDRVNLVKEAMRRCMVQDHHYGIIPGTKKPSLWKPGAELICTLFQFGQRFPKGSIEVQPLDGGHFLFTVSLELFYIPTGRTIGQGVGACCTMEGRYRLQCEDHINKYGQHVKARGTPYDFYNTCLKLAKKRALVDAVLTATDASVIFTQDTEDNPDLYRDASEVQPSRNANSNGYAHREVKPATTERSANPPEEPSEEQDATQKPANALQGKAGLLAEIKRRVTSSVIDKGKVLEAVHNLGIADEGVPASFTDLSEIQLKDVIGYWTEIVKEVNGEKSAA